MKLTAKQRARIYRKAAEYLLDPINWSTHPGCCDGMKWAFIEYSKGAMGFIWPPKEYEEFWLFAPSEPGGTFWWSRPENGPPLEERLICLLLCAEMAQNK